MKTDNNVASAREETVLHAQGYSYVAGIDEAGRGPFAGPVVAAAVIFPESMRFRWVKEVRDSKLLTAAKREEIYQRICKCAVTWAVGVMGVDVIDREGIAVAARLAMKTAVDHLNPRPDFLLIDYFTVPEIDIPQKGVVEGDTYCLSIAAASILAKVSRDRVMVELDRQYPGYHFAENKGYGTSSHYEGLARLGPCPEHRRSFRPVKEAGIKKNGP